MTPSAHACALAGPLDALVKAACPIHTIQSNFGCVNSPVKENTLNGKPVTLHIAAIPAQPPLL